MEENSLRGGCMDTRKNVGTLTTTLSVDKMMDTTIYDNGTYPNSSDSTMLRVGVLEDGTIARSLIKFELPTIPTGYKMVKATLCLPSHPNITDLEGVNTDRKVQVYALNQSWEQTYRELTEVGIRLGCLIDEVKCYDSYLTSKGWIKCKQERKPNGKKYTGIEFCDKIAQKDKVYIIHIGTGHISVVVDKKVNDTWDCTGGCVGNYWIKA